VSAIVIEQLGRRYGDVQAVADVNLQVQPGEFVTLLGPSGCGKTTTLRMVAGLERASSGRIRIGELLASDPAAGIHVPPERRSLGMVFQSYAIWPHLSVFENVAYPLRIRRRPQAEVRQRVVEALRLVELEAYAERPAPALSGGQQQRVAIARALVFEPQVLLLDEPMSNLDARLRTQMGDDFRRLQQRLRITTLYVTHDQSEAMALSDRVVVMHGGRILQLGPPAEVYHRPATAAVASFFGTPNLVLAEVVQCRGDAGSGWQLALQGQGWRANGRAGQALAPGSRVTVLIRAEDLLLQTDAEPAHGSARWAGTVVEAAFRGPVCSLVVDCAGTRWNVDAPSQLACAVGSTVGLAARDGAAWVLPDRQPESPR